MLAHLVALVLTAQQPNEIALVSGLGISGVTQGGRVPAPIDTLQSQIVEGKWTEPHADNTVPGARGNPSKWVAVTANKDGVFEGGPTQGGYVLLTAESDSDKPMLLHASGDTMVYINGEPRAGDPYSFGYLKIPFLMKKGRNTFLFSCGRGRLQAKLMAPPSSGPLFLNIGDLTLPDAIVGSDETLVGGVPVVNCSGKRIKTATLIAALGGGRVAVTRLPPIEPYSVRKVPFEFSAPQGAAPGEFDIRLLVVDGTKTGLVTPQEEQIKVRVRKPTEHYKRTFISQIDGSVQYYAVTPSLSPWKTNALILTVHGASVEALNQAQAYRPKDWCTIVAPTNRRPYGFDWEDWGRMDAMEVWNLAKSYFPHDPARVMLTGHSMGGHGTWQLGLTYPNEFAAIGPSAGWISFWSYAGGWTPREPNAVEDILFRSTASSDTLKMLPNALTEDVFILHGDKDDNVPVQQARTMRDELTKIGADFQYHEEPGAGHWWGDQCVDWPPMFDMFKEARLTTPDKWEFVTLNPAVSATNRGFTIHQQIEPLKPSRIVARKEADGWHVSTENVAFLSFDPEAYSQLEIDDWSPALPKFDGKQRTPTEHYLRRTGTSWKSVKSLPRDQKGPTSSGPFKLAFTNRVALVVGTRGTTQEQSWAIEKARFDAESWYYRGNGAVDVITDGQIGAYKNRNLILYGNADTNGAFRLIGKCPIQVRRGKLNAGDKTFHGDDLAAVYLYPEGNRLIGIVGGTGLRGFRYAERMPYFTSGVAYPDWSVFRTTALSQGSKQAVAAGFFNSAWKFDPKLSAFLGQ
jgi:pimeloyl-ACP methyl ester carboxylesterase